MEYSDGWFTGLAARVHGFPRDPLGLKDNSDSQSGVLSGILSFKSVGEIKMKIVISALVVLVLMIGALIFPMEKQQSAFALRAEVGHRITEQIFRECPQTRF